MRGMLSTYVLVLGGLVAGTAVGVFVLDYDPDVAGWLFGAGAGLSLGAFVAALVTNTPLVGAANQQTHRGVIRSYDNIGDDEPEPDRLGLPNRAGAAVSEYDLDEPAQRRSGHREGPGR